MSSRYVSEDGAQQIVVSTSWVESGSGMIPPGTITFMRWVGPQDQHMPVVFRYAGDARD